MPIFDMKCPKCGKVFKDCHINNDAPIVCPWCGKAKLEKLPSRVAIAFKGKGWTGKSS